MRGRIVRSLSGHDKGELAVIVGLDGDGRLLLSNGKTRKLETPKKKKKKHAEMLEDVARLSPEVMRSDRGIRRALAAVKIFLETKKG